MLCSTLATGVGDMPDIDFIRADIEHMRHQVARLRGDIRSFNILEFPPPLPAPCLIGCSTRSTSFAPNATGSRRNSQVTTRARWSEVGIGERSFTQPRAIGRR